MEDAAPLKQRTIKSAFARALIDPEHLELEPKLAESCWIEYAYMTPWDRTDLFAQHYLNIYRQMYSKYVNHSDADNRTPTSPALASNRPSAISALWRARQLSDVVGMPYTEFLRWMFDASMREGHKRLPAPNQLYDETHFEELLVYWEGHQKLRSLDVFGWDRRFLSWNYRGEPPQRRLHDIVRSRVGKNSLTLANYMREGMPVLTEAHAREYFGDELTDEALRSTGPIPIKRAEPLPAYVPSCIGLVSGLTADCDTCPLRTKCSFMDAEVQKVMLKEFGCADPRKERERKRARDRKRDSRARKKAVVLEAA